MKKLSKKIEVLLVENIGKSFNAYDKHAKLKLLCQLFNTAN